MPSLLTAVTLFTALSQASVYQDFKAEYEAARTAVYVDLPSIKEPHLKDWKCEEAYADYSQTIDRNPPVLFQNVRVLNRPHLSEEYSLENTSVASLVCRTDKKYSLQNTSNFRLEEQDLDFQSATPLEIETSCRLGSIPRSLETTATATEMSQTDYLYLPQSSEKKSFRVSDRHLYMKVEWTLAGETVESILRCTRPQNRELQEDDSNYDVQLEADTSLATAVWYKLGIGRIDNFDLQSRTYLWLNDSKILSESQKEFARKNEQAEQVQAILNRGRKRPVPNKKAMAFTIPSPKKPSTVWTTPNPDIQLMMDRLVAYDRNNPHSVEMAKRRVTQIINAFGIIGSSTRAIGDWDNTNARSNVDRKVAPGDCQYSSGRELNRINGTRIIECNHLTPAARGKPQYR